MERNKGVAVSSRQDWTQEQLDNLELGLLQQPTSCLYAVAVQRWVKAQILSEGGFRKQIQ